MVVEKENLQFYQIFPALYKFLGVKSFYWAFY